MTIMAHDWKPSPAQIELLKNIFVERVPMSEPNRDQFWLNLTENISNRATFQDAMNKLKARPKVLPNPPGRSFLLGQAPLKPEPPTPPTLPDVAKEPGLYRDPEDGTLYRMSVSKPKNSWSSPVVRLSVYSNKATIRRLTPEGRLVKKGKWTALKAHERDALLSFGYQERRGYKPVGKKVLASWFLSDEEKQEWAVGICLMCYKGLTDGVSVYNQIGPVCAKNWGFELQTPPLDFNWSVV